MKIIRLAEHPFTRYFIFNSCKNRYFQAAQYSKDKDNNGKKEFPIQYDKEFEKNASELQKSFRDVHEMLRSILNRQTKQIQQLTIYFHSRHFYYAKKYEVIQQIIHISRKFSHVGENGKRDQSSTEFFPNQEETKILDGDQWRDCK